MRSPPLHPAWELHLWQLSVDFTKWAPSSLLDGKTLPAFYGRCKRQTSGSDRTTTTPKWHVRASSVPSCRQQPVSGLSHSRVQQASRTLNPVSTQLVTVG